MDIQNINNSTINNISHLDIGQTKTPSVSSEVGKVNNIEIDIQNSQQHSLASNVGKYINNISLTASVSSIVNNQLSSLDTMQSKLENISQEDNIQKDVAQFISNYNRLAGNINTKVDKLSDLEGDSTTYFDGSAGAIPLDVAILTTSIDNKKAELVDTASQMQEINDTFKVLAKNVIITATQKTQEASPFKEINFGKESADFSATNMNNVIGSIASSQANAMQTQSVRLLT